MSLVLNDGELFAQSLRLGLQPPGERLLATASDRNFLTSRARSSSFERFAFASWTPTDSVMNLV
jgi:hypothetical protein